MLAIAYGFAAVVILVGGGAVIAMQAARTPADVMGPGTPLQTAACSSTDGATTSGDVDDTAWSVAIIGSPPNVSIMATVDGALTGGLESDKLSWWNHERGYWEWIYQADAVDVVAGKVPVGATARATLGDGTMVALCTAGSGLDHGVDYAAGAFPSETVIKLVEVVDPEGTTLGVWDLAEHLQLVRIERGEEGFGFGGGIEIPTPQKADAPVSGTP